jgi:hypothetical protein
MDFNEDRLFGSDPLFIFDPADPSNGPDPEFHGSVIQLWPVFPQFLRDAFIRSFTEGIRNRARRVTESEWREIMVKLRDSLFLCPSCSYENFYDPMKIRLTGSLGKCNNDRCAQPLPLPPRMRFKKRNYLVLVPGTTIFPYHLEGSHERYDFEKGFDRPLATVTPSGIKNLSSSKWILRNGADSTDVPPGGVVPLTDGAIIAFPGTEGEIKLS